MIWDTYTWDVLIIKHTIKWGKMDVLVRVFAEKRQFWNSENNEYIIYRVMNKAKGTNKDCWWKHGLATPEKVSLHSLKGSGKEIGILEPRREQKPWKTTCLIASVTIEESSHFHDPGVQAESKRELGEKYLHFALIFWSPSDLSHWLNPTRIQKAMNLDDYALRPQPT